MFLTFVVDAMLGTLAKWLRLLGYDAFYDPGLDDNQLVRIARAQGRVLLTRDRELSRRRGVRALLINSEDLEHQVRQVLSELGLEPNRAFSRCPICNEPLEHLAPELARAQVPPYVARTQRAFKQCPACQRIYWRGSHRRQMDEKLSSLVHSAVDDS